MLDADTISMLDHLFQPLTTFAADPELSCQLTQEIDHIKQALVTYINDRTAQLAAVNAALRTAEARQRALLNAVPDIVLRMSTDGTYLDFSDPHNKLRLPKDRLIGSNVRDWHFSSETIAHVLAAYQQAVDTGEIQTVEYTTTRDAEKHNYESRIVRCGPNEVVSIAREITDQKKAEVARHRQTQLALFRAEFTEAINRPDPLPTILNTCATAIVRHLDMAFVRIWLFNPESDLLELAASAGCYTHLDGLHSRIPLGAYKIGRIAQARQPDLCNQIAENPHIDQEWAVRAGMVAFAGYPLLVEDRLVGVIGMFARHTLPDDTLEVLGSTALIVAQGIERRRTEQALRASEARFRSVFEQAAVGIAHLRLDGHFLLANQKLCDIVGHTREELLTTSFQAITHPEDLPGNLEYIGQLLRGEMANFRMEKRYRRQDGTYVWAELTVALVRDATGEPIHFIGIVEDNAKRKAAEAMLEQRAAQLALINDIGSKIAAELDLDSLLSRAARLVHEQFGYQHVSLYLLDQNVAHLKAIAGIYADFFAPNHTQLLSQGIIGWVGTHGEKVVANDIKINPHYISLIPSRVTTKAELCLPIKIGEKTVGVLDVQSNQFAAFSENDVVAMEILSDQIAVALENARLFQVAQQELAERRRVEAELRLSEQRLRQIINLVPHFIFAKDIDGRFILANQATAEVYGTTVDDLLRKTDADFARSAAEVEHFRSDDLEVIRSGQIKVIAEEQITDAGGATRILQTTKIPFTFSGTTVPAVLGVAIDITERKHHEEALRLSEQRLRQIIDLMPHTIFAKDSNGRLILANQALADVYGLKVEEVLGKTKAELGSTPEQVDLWTQQEQESLQRNQAIVHAEEVMVDRAGRRRTFQATTLPFTFSGTDYPAVLGVVIEITDLKQAEEAVRKLNAELEERVQERTSQLAAINRELEAFCYSVSHDLRAPLRAVNGFSQALLEDYNHVLDEEGQNYLARVRSASQRMGVLIDDLLNLSRVSRHQIRRSPVNLSAIAENIDAELRASQPQRRVTFNVTPDLWVQADANLVPILLRNLLDNAWKYTSHHATATIAVGVQAVDGLPTYFVRDDGAGFDMAYADKLFGAFQRLHRPDEFEGTGIGLATVERIVHRHGGQVCGHGMVEQGATFCFTLPDSKE